MASRSPDYWQHAHNWTRRDHNRSRSKSDWRDARDDRKSSARDRSRTPHADRSAVEYPTRQDSARGDRAHRDRSRGPGKFKRLQCRNFLVWCSSIGVVVRSLCEGGLHGWPAWLAWGLYVALETVLNEYDLIYFSMRASFFHRYRPSRVWPTPKVAISEQTLQVQSRMFEARAECCNICDLAYSCESVGLHTAEW